MKTSASKGDPMDIKVGDVAEMKKPHPCDEELESK